MSIAASDLLIFQAANHAQDDAATQGGAIATAGKVEFTQLTANVTPAMISDGADTRNCTITGRDATGAIVSETKALNGAVEVVFATTFERMLKIVLASGDASRTVLVKQGSGGATRATLGPNITSQRALFYDSSSAAGIVIRYEKFFFKQNHGTLTLNNAAVTLTADPAARIRVGCAPSKGDSATATNRITAPASVTFVDDSVAQGVPTGALAAGETIGVWAEENLPASDAANRTTFTAQLSGTTV
jgi:hypothetical protein